MSGLTAVYQPSWLVRVTLYMRDRTLYTATARWNTTAGAQVSRLALKRRGIDYRKVREVRSTVGNKLAFVFVEKL